MRCRIEALLSLWLVRLPASSHLVGIPIADFFGGGGEWALAERFGGEMDRVSGNSGTGVASQYNPLDPDYAGRIQEVFAAAHREAPVFFSPLYNVWVVTRYDDIWKVLKDPGRFSSSLSTNVATVDPPEVIAILKEGWGQLSTLVTCDPPAHNRYRGLINKAFTPRRVNEREGLIRSTANRLVDNFIDRGETDLIWSYAYPLPMTIIASILGVADDDLDRFKRWSDDLVGRLSFDLLLQRRIECARSLVEFQRYFNELLNEREKNPRDDMLTDLLNARLEGVEPLNRGEMLSMIQQLLVAGNETTTSLIGNMMSLLLERRERWEALCADPRLAQGTVEEALRMESPVQGLFRVAMEDVELGGVAIPKGAQLQLLYAAGNRDEAEFKKAAEFDMRRDNAVNHLAFGGGVHFCLGASLARLEARIALETLVERIPDIRLAPDREPKRVAHFFMRGFEKLPVVWGDRR